MNQIPTDIDTPLAPAPLEDAVHNIASNRRTCLKL